MTTQKEIEKLLTKLPINYSNLRRICVNDVKESMPKKATAALELTDKWLKTPHLVSEKELVAAANAAAAAAHAAYVAHAAAHAADVAHAAANANKEKRN